MDNKDLKILALKEAVGNLTSSYEEKVADLRVELTQKASIIEELQRRVRELDVQAEEGPANAAE